MMISVYLTLVLFITIIIEWIIYYFFIRKKPWYLFLISVLINALTLPLATYFYYYIYYNFFLIELIVVICESFLLFLLLKLKYSQSLLLSFSANVVTALLSFLF
jgi:hypothetical protein